MEGTHVHRIAGPQRWGQRLAGWLALTLLLSALVAPLLLTESAAAKPHGKGHHSRDQHHGKHRDGKHQAGKRHKHRAGNRQGKAQPSGQPTGGQPTGLDHCVGELVAGVDGVQHEACFATFAEAQAAAPGGAGSAPAGDGHVERSNQAVVAILYDYANYNANGGTYTYWMNNSAVGCTTGLSLTMTSMPTGWNDRVSSARVFGGCKATYYTESGLWGGTITGTAANGYDIPDMGSYYGIRISSIRWTKA
jgi:hypothetical protein